MTVLCVGDMGLDTTLVVDHVPQPDEKVIAQPGTDHVGGVAANAAFAAARAGAQVRFLGATGDDPDGARVVDGFRSTGVDVSVSPQPGATCRALILVEKSGEKRIVLVPGVSMYPSAEAVAGMSLDGVTWVHTAPYDAPAASVLADRCAAANVPLSVDLEPSAIPPSADGLEALVRGAAAVFCNLRAVAQLRTAGGVERLLDMGVQRIVLTCGSAGVAVVTVSGRYDIDVPQLGRPIVDTTGAGDCLAGWYAARMSCGIDELAAMREAVAAASLACTRLGAQHSYPTLTEVTTLTAMQPILNPDQRGRR